VANCNCRLSFGDLESNYKLVFSEEYEIIYTAVNKYANVVFLEIIKYKLTLLF
jgi:hypothetical protein